MNKINNFFMNYKKSIVMILVIVILIIVIFKSCTINASSPSKEEVSVIEMPKEENETNNEIMYIVVDVKGAVNNPGAYKLPNDSYVYDAINKAGGLLENANTSVINLSKRLKDEMVIIIYTNEELEQMNSNEIKTKYIEIEAPCNCPDTMNDACINDNNKSNDNTTTNSLVSINNATKDELLTITGIGESKAISIINYREQNGLFNSIEDIKNVSGIGDALFEKIKNYITV